ncbi:hypothetical protein JMG10_27385 [Nostoc ellipsosporum NOK]|jgi:hypothetical protein|nr:hypothetical protein [Nostoc ellipsosporum NOK]
MADAKIRLSSEEMELVLDDQWILTKNRVLGKVNDLLVEVLEAQQALFPSFAHELPESVMAISPKISRGDQYRGLPWLMLDHPRHFGREATFAIRTFFWWGNYMSVTLHLSGDYQRQYSPALLASFSLLQQQGWLIATGESAWEHHVEEQNYKPLAAIDGRQFAACCGQPFLKLVKLHSLKEWDQLIGLLTRDAEQLLSALTGISYPGGETGL